MHNPTVAVKLSSALVGWTAMGLPSFSQEAGKVDESELLIPVSVCRDLCMMQAAPSHLFPTDSAHQHTDASIQASLWD